MRPSPDADGEPRAVTAGKVLQGLAVLWGSFTLVFLIFTAIPDPARQLAGQQADAELIADMRARFGLDKPWHERYVDALGGLSPLGRTEEGWGLRWPSLGESFVRQESVASLIAEAFPGTAILALSALLFALVLGIPMGLLATRRPGGWFDRIVVGGSVLGMSAPSFFAAVLIGFLLRCAWGSGPGCRSPAACGTSTRMESASSAGVTSSCRP